MEGRETPATSSELYGARESRGAGGKLRREKKPPSTPYDRPPRSNSGWISKIFTPAKRLITGSATRLLPSLFSPLPPPSPESPTPDERPAGVEQEIADHNTSCSVDLFAPKSIGGVGPGDSEGKSKLHISDKDKHDKLGDCSDGQVSAIEQLIKRKTFSREEIDHLMEVLHSRVVDEEQERQLPGVSGLGKAESAETSHGKQNTSVDKDELDKFKWTMATPFPRSIVQDEIDASPVDIARAYMGSRTSEVGFTSMGSKPFMPSPLPKAPVCWPGAITQDQQGFSTPQSQKGRYGLQSFPRTPYSRTLFTKSKSKVTPFRGDSEKFPSISSTPFQPVRTPVYGKSITNMTEGSYGSGGPIRRMRNKYSTTPARDSTFLQTAQRSPWTKESNANSILKKNFEPGTSSTRMEPVLSKQQNSEVGVPSVHPHSSKVAKQILEQLDRPITLKEKSEELKLVSSWKKLPEAASASPNQNNSSPCISGAGGNKGLVIDTVKLTGQTDGENTVPRQDRTNVASGAGKSVVSAFMISFDKTSNSSGSNVEPSSSIQNRDSQVRSPDEAINNNLLKRNGQCRLTGDQSRGVDITNISSGSEPQHAQRRPVLPSISIDKSGLRTSFASHTSTGFTFPFTTSSSTSTEPPTPSIMPSTSTSPTQQPKVPAQSPTFTIGSKITIAPPVVSFPPPSAGSTPNDASAPKFKFRSGKTRLSFALAGNDVASAPNDAATPKYTFESGESRLNLGSIESDAVHC